MDEKILRATDRARHARHAREFRDFNAQEQQPLLQQAARVWRHAGGGQCARKRRARAPAGPPGGPAGG